MKTWNWEAGVILCHTSAYIVYQCKNDALILTILYCHIDFSNVHEWILTAIYFAVFVLLLMHVLLWLSLSSFLYIVRNDKNKGDQSMKLIIHSQTSTV